jgi:tetratricopeptide (TPR) repeat protein
MCRLTVSLRTSLPPIHATGAKSGRRTRNLAIQIETAAVLVGCLTGHAVAHVTADRESGLKEIENARVALGKLLSEESFRQSARVGHGKAAGPSDTLPAPKPDTLRSCDRLKLLVDRFEAKFGSDSLSDSENLTLRLSKATIANARRRFEEALAVTTTRGAPADVPGAKRQERRDENTLKVRGDALFGLQKWGEALVYYEKAAAIKQDFEVWFRIAWCLDSSGRAADSVKAYDQCIKLLEEGVSQGRNDVAEPLATALTNRGAVLRGLGRPGEAVNDYDRAIATSSALPERQSWYSQAIALTNRGNALRLLGRPADAFKDYDRASSLMGRLLVAEDSDSLRADLATCLAARGFINRTLGDHPQALKDLTKAVDGFEALLEKTRISPALTGRLATALTNRASVLAALGRPGESMNDYERAISLYARLDKDKARDDFSDGLAGSLSGHGTLIAQLGKPADSLNDFDKSVSLYTRLVELQARADLADGLAATLTSRGNVLRMVGRLREAKDDVEKSLRIYTKLFEKEGRVDLADQFATAMQNNSVVLAVLGKPSEALPGLNRAVEIFTRLSTDGRRTDLARNLADCLEDRGITLNSLGKKDEAERDFRRSDEIRARLDKEKK